MKLLLPYSRVPFLLKRLQAAWLFAFEKTEQSTSHGVQYCMHIICIIEDPGAVRGVGRNAEKRKFLSRSLNNIYGLRLNKGAETWSQHGH